MTMQLPDIRFLTSKKLEYAYLQGSGSSRQTGTCLVLAYYL